VTSLNTKYSTSPWTFTPHLIVANWELTNSEWSGGRGGHAGHGGGSILAGQCQIPGTGNARHQKGSF